MYLQLDPAGIAKLIVDQNVTATTARRNSPKTTAHYTNLKQLR